MKQKKSNMGIAAGIVLGILFLYDAAIDIVIMYPLKYHDPFWCVEQIADGCVSVFLIISLFRDRRSWLLLAAHIINVIMILRQIADILQSGSCEFLFFLMFLIMIVSLILRTIMVVYFCVPSLQKRAGWTGKIWLLPPVLSGTIEIIRILHYQEMYLERFSYHPLWVTFQLSLNKLSIVYVFLFCLWLTEPVRIRKKNSDFS